MIVVSWLAKPTLIAAVLARPHSFPMNNLNSLQEIARAIRNLIRTGIVTDVDLDEGLCRVQTGGTDGHIAMPPRGATLTLWLGWQDSALIKKGTFTVNADRLRIG